MLVVWEDTYFEPLAEILGQVVRKLARSPDGSRPSILHHTARSNTAFDRYVGTTWPKISPRGLPMNPGPIDHVICVIDADKISDLLQQDVPHPPSDANQIASWHIAAEHAWQLRLRHKCPSKGGTIPKPRSGTRRKTSAGAATLPPRASRTAIRTSYSSTCSPGFRDRPEVAR